jgi:diguanylate cyclase (GGDEF)-like protein
LTDDPSPSGDLAPTGAAELARVKGQIESARALLARLLQDVVVAESRLGMSEAARLLEANEQLVITALRDQTDAAIAAKALARVARSAEIDALTALPNRSLMLDRFTQAIATAKRHQRRLALLFLDLNNFKQVNDTMGHGVGDEVLKLVAHRLVAAVRDADTVSRHGGDEFVILLTEITQPSDAGHIADALALALAVPSRIGDQILRLTASIGIAIYPDNGDDVTTLMHCADTAMYQARRRGLGSMAFYDPSATMPAELDAATDPAVVRALRDPLARHSVAVEEQQRQHAELREANEQLVLAALDARQLQAAAERARRHQAEFMALVANELSSPMAPIRVAAAMLGQMRSTEPLLPRAQSIIDQQIENMTRLVAAVQAVAHAGRPVLDLDRQVVDFAEVVDQAVATCRPAMDTRLQALTIHLAGRPVPVLGERARLGQMVRNLLDNASQYTPDLGRIDVSLAIQASRVELTVSDSGIGITAQALPTIFEPFAQDMPAIGFRSVGLGIGLSLVRALAEAHGGSVVARSAGAGQGSQFTIALPLAPSAAGAA